jgi:hypothetical protein
MSKIGIMSGYKLVTFWILFVQSSFASPYAGIKKRHEEINYPEKLAGTGLKHDRSAGFGRLAVPYSLF